MFLYNQSTEYFHILFMRVPCPTIIISLVPWHDLWPWCANGPIAEPISLWTAHGILHWKHPREEDCNLVCSFRFRSKMEIVCSHCQESGFVTWSLARTVYYTSLSKCCCKIWRLFFLDIYKSECSLVLSWSTVTRSSTWMHAGENIQGLSGRASGLPVFGRRVTPAPWSGQRTGKGGTAHGRGHTLGTVRAISQHFSNWIASVLCVDSPE